MWMYNLVIRCYALLIHLSSLRNQKAKLWVKGRKNWRKTLQSQINALGSGERVWMHCASYGEFEQGRPLLEAIRTQKPHYKIVLSFFSPSGYEAFKNWKGADVVCYLPFDSASNARDFVGLVQASKVIFIKYEFWLNVLKELKKNKAEAYLVSAVFKPHHPFFKWYGGIFKDSLSAFKSIFVQDKQSLQLLEKAGIYNAILSGDTRFDRVMQIQKNFEPLSFFERYTSGHAVIVAGSTWAKDEVFLLEAYTQLKNKKVKWILVPHEVNHKSISETEERLREKGVKYTLFSACQENTLAEPVMVLDTVGLLSRLYHYADVCYIGGGFDSGIHNLLEPAVHLKPVLFSGKADFSKYNEAQELIEIGAAKAVQSKKELVEALNDYIERQENKDSLRKKIKSYFDTRVGSTQKVMERVFGNKE